MFLENQAKAEPKLTRSLKSDRTSVNRAVLRTEYAGATGGLCAGMPLARLFAPPGQDLVGQIWRIEPAVLGCAGEFPIEADGDEEKEEWGGGSAENWHSGTW